ncbi:hypothetical protein [Frankia sp. Cppng1_Ct_nod]|uniref:hypothetical protein n=1 Tax=Frankia sp. Cppng1_Ct_nod TaxID=2897162 RepID=UPI001040E133|nr:hypothetical protein [Frankia sp. Cppng1_Ct_nod]
MKNPHRSTVAIYLGILATRRISSAPLRRPQDEDRPLRTERRLRSTPPAGSRHPTDLLLAFTNAAWSADRR